MHNFVAHALSGVLGSAMRSFLQTAACLATLALVLATTSCYSVKSHSGVNPSLASVPAVDRLTVIAIDERPEVRTMFERELATALQSSKTTVTEGYRAFPINELKGDRETLRQKFVTAGVPFILVSRVSDRTVAASSGPKVGVGGSFDWADLDSSRYQLYTSGGEIKTHLRVDTKLYRVSDAQVLWGAATDMVLDENYVPEKMLRALTSKIAGQLKRDGVVR
jgi:hypothetical protein